MGARLVADAPAVAAAYPWGTLDHVVDVGGGDASSLIAILRAHGDLRRTVVGSFFDALPAGAGGYVLSGVLHDWG
jgi:hypothetical protein